ncbi:MAG: V-type ATPase subunit [Gammaproteobacteria bacterium]|nr:V-type ATPase subunit [Gammaproteobacteria bacterium]
MSGFASQAYLRTRLAILGANLLGAARLAELAQMPLDELVAATGFDELESDRRTSSLAIYERSLMQTWLDELSALLRPLGGPARRLLTQWASRYEVLNIKALVRGKLGQLPNEHIEQSLFELPGFLGLNHNDLLNTDNVPELLRRLQRTRYRGLATQALRRFEERPDPFLIDATLDQQFYGELINRAQMLGGDDRTETVNLIGRIVDRHNLVWSLRYRFNYGLQPSEVLYLAIDGGRVLNRPVLQQILQSETLEQAVQQLPRYLASQDQLPTRITHLDAVLRNDLHDYAHGAMRRSPSAVTSVLAYLVLRHGEMKDLYAIVHARVNGIADELLQHALDPLAGEAA